MSATCTARRKARSITASPPTGSSLPNFSLPGDLSPSARYWHRDVVTPEWTMDDEGMVRVPRERPGLGVTIDREFLDSLTVRTEELTARTSVAMVG